MNDDLQKNPGHEYFQTIPIECELCGKTMIAHEVFIVVHLDTGSPKCGPADKTPTVEGTP